MRSGQFLVQNIAGHSVFCRPTNAWKATEVQPFVRLKLSCVQMQLSLIIATSTTQSAIFADFLWCRGNRPFWGPFPAFL
jgi:hypothetical protein